jgi:hypothetical protein
MCSKCYRDHCKTQQVAESPKPAAPVVEAVPAAVLAAAAPSREATPAPAAAAPIPATVLPVQEAPCASPAPAPVAAPEPEKKKSNRCACCSKKVGLTGFTCKCGGLFCSAHRMADDHQCGFDYKMADRQKISMQNQACVAAKIDKI